MNKTQILVIFSILFFFQQSVFSQKNQENQFLQKVGTLDSLYSESLKEYREVYIQLPASYDPKKKEKYPVVYILDGEVFLPTVNNVQDFYSGGFTPEMVLVGISNAHNRTRDLTTSKITEKYGIPFKEENGGAENFSKFIETELIPFIEKKYPVTNFRTLIGHSYGGLFSIYTFINHSYLFSNYLAIDPSLDWDDQKLLKEAKEKLSSQNYKGKSLFISLSGQLHLQNPKVTIENVMHDTSDFTLFSRSNIAFSNMVEQNKNIELTFRWKFYPKDLHGTVPFPSIMDGLIFGFEWYQMENTDKFNSPSTSKEELFKIINYRAKKLKNYFGYSTPPYPVDLLNALGYMSLDMEQLEKSKMFFEFAIEFFPNNPNTYDSMSEYYERVRDYNNAIKFATKAYEINQSDYYRKRIETLKR
ncbi:alpha/beta hydrolase-fold protein [uncultured Flavobacterium sp.]|uniref:alpha/beta hydrolase-fold protein n=1 Tax=uncultured Flavobacterium sp. TaxID=165435 RepID=UPI0030EE1D7E